MYIYIYIYCARWLVKACGLAPITCGWVVCVFNYLLSVAIRLKQFAFKKNIYQLFQIYISVLGFGAAFNHCSA